MRWCNTSLSRSTSSQKVPDRHRWFRTAPWRLPWPHKCTYAKISTSFEHKDAGSGTASPRPRHHRHTIQTFGLSIKVVLSGGDITDPRIRPSCPRHRRHFHRGSACASTVADGAVVAAGDARQHKASIVLSMTIAFCGQHASWGWRCYSPPSPRIVPILAAPSVLLPSRWYQRVL